MNPLLAVLLSIIGTTSTLHYDLTIIIDFDNLRFTSQVEISSTALESRRNLTLQTENLEISEVPVEVPVTYLQDSLILYPSHSGKYKFLLTYNGKLDEEQEGLYVAKGAERLIALTNFHYNKANRVFPCDDDPTQPATFNLSIVRPKDYVAVANTLKIAEEEYDQDRIKDIFAKTDLIPTYMLSFAVIDFTGTTYEGVTVYSRSNQETQFLGQWSSQVVREFQQLENFTLTTTQQIVVPDGTLPVDVLENVGLILYKESVVLYDPERETVKDKQEIAKIVARAIVRQWYKNKESFKWWPNYWVIEGLTALYEYEVLEALEPSWRVEEQFLVEELEDSLEYEVEDGFSLVLTEDETPDSFSKLHQIKAFDLVRMFLHFPESGTILEDEDNDVAQAWSRNQGYPVLSVARDYKTNVLTFAQSGTNVRPVPITVTTDEAETQNFIMEDNTQTSSVPASTAWYLVKRLGYFRINYDTSNWENITTFLLNPANEIDQIPPTDRAALIDDAFNLAPPYSIYLELVQYLKRENDYIPVHAFIRTANRFSSLLAHSSTQNLFRTFATNLIEHFYDNLGTTIQESEPHLDTLSRAKISTWLCKFGYQRCHQHMKEILEESTERLRPDLQEPVFCGSMETGTSSDILVTEFNLTRKSRILESLACTSDPAFLKNYMLVLVDKSPILKLEPSEKFGAFAAILESSLGVDLLLNFVQEYFGQLEWSFTGEEISRMLIALSKKLMTEEQEVIIDEIIANLSEAQSLKYQEMFQRVKTNIGLNLEWRGAHLEAIEEWLSTRVEENNAAVQSSLSIFFYMLSVVVLMI